MLNGFFTASDRVTEFGWIIKNLIHNGKMVGQIWIEGLSQTDPITRYLSWIIILTVLLIVALLILRLLVWLIYATFPRLYERIDLLKLDYRYRNKKWELPVIWTAVLCLYNRGIIGIQSPLQNSGERAVDLTFSRIQYDPNLLNSDEQYLIHWLFNKSGGSTFAARSIAGPDLSNASHRSRLFYYRARLDMLYSRLCTWSVLVSKRYRLRSQKRYEIQRKISFMIGIILAMLMPLLLFIDHNPSGSMIFPSLDQIVFIVLLASLFILIISTASFFLFLGYVGSMRQKTLRATVIKRIPALIVVADVALLLLLRQDQIGLFDSSTMVIIGVTFIFLISSYVFPIAIITVPLASFRYRLSHGAYRKVRRPDRLERLLQASIVLECGNDFLITHPQLKVFASQYPEYAMLLHAERVIAAKHIVFQSQFEFEKYDTEHPYENYDKQHSGGFKYSSNDSYVSNSYNSYSNSDSDDSCLSDNPGSHHMDLSSHGSDSNDSGNSSDSNSN